MFSDNIKDWKVDLSTNGEVLSGVNVRRDMFERDVIFQLIFVTWITPTELILRKAEACY